MKISEIKNTTWEEMLFSDCLQKVKVGREKQVKEKDYLKIGNFPIVDQGQSAIAGYTNNPEKVISDLQPFIIFGDHTRILKYIDFPIALGADGTKIIKPKSIFDTKFFFFFLKHINIPSRGYNRHFTLLKEKSVSKPPLAEQQHIARVLTTVQDAIASQEELIAKLKELKRSAMKHLFTHGTKGEKTKMTEIGEVPESWEVIKIKSLGKIITGNTPPTKRSDYYGGQFKLVSPADLTEKMRIQTSHKKLTAAGLAVARAVPKNTILVGCIGNVGKIGITDDEVTAFNQQINGIVVNEQNDYLFTFYLLSYYRDILESKSAKVTVPILNKNNFENIELVKPDISEQKNISEIIFSIDQKIEIVQEKLLAYQNLFKTLLHELMSGERRIK